MGKYVYEGNNDPHDGTEKITGLGEDGTDVLTIGGPAREVTDEQLAVLSSRYQLRTEGSSSDDLAGQELQERARALDISGRSEMRADELREAVATAESGDTSAGDTPGAGESPTGSADTTQASTAAAQAGARRGGRST